ncbi:DUF3750 domain-containing protein [Lichenihabitans sp. Uapishka_5]|uniref:DUF3750 domain-containing protein n=1 Tax=Lichenihabitans sp. Uapishka_5 TaxID=3037302 RepID=UPI0029E7F0CD|nr:DUF3750 domain-containing protein [Lichenihabitans sp. Uapishka_5]MDX7950197.1 DUF3750 domain-containing protein [Lichenihabitans sp. Uapishka_5]
MPRPLIALLLFCLAYLGPVAWRALAYYRAPASVWWSADRSSAGLLRPAHQAPEAAVRIYAAPTVSWRGIFAVHCWIVLKPADAPAYQRWDLTAWGDPIRVDGFSPDGRWFGQVPEPVFTADGAEAAAMIPRLRAAIDRYRFRHQGDYRAWPGPNSNTFVATVMAAVPEMGATLPPNAIGKDFPVEGRWFGPTPSRTGLRLNLGGYFGLTVGWIEGFELNLLGGVIGFDLRRPALKLPGVGRIGMATG